MRKVMFHCSIQLMLIGSALIGVRSAEADWFWQNPWPQGNDARAVAMPDAQAVFIVSGGSVVKSTDAGGTWTVQNVEPSGSNLGLADISCVNAQRCAAVGTVFTRKPTAEDTSATRRSTCGPSTVERPGAAAGRIDDLARQRLRRAST
jgi:hypothetical protein